MNLTVRGNKLYKLSHVLWLMTNCYTKGLRNQAIESRHHLLCFDEPIPPRPTWCASWQYRRWKTCRARSSKHGGVGWRTRVSSAKIWACHVWVGWGEARMDAPLSVQRLCILSILGFEFTINPTIDKSRLYAHLTNLGNDIGGAHKIHRFP